MLSRVGLFMGNHPARSRWGTHEKPARMQTDVGLAAQPTQDLQQVHKHKEGSGRRRAQGPGGGGA